MSQTARKTHMGSGARTMPAFQAQPQLTLVKPRSQVGRSTEAASMGVTIAVLEASKRGAMSVYDAKHLNRSDRQQYQRLCGSEWGITEWARGESPTELHAERTTDDMAQFDNLSFMD